MSLKAVHFLLILSSILLSYLFCAWAVREFLRENGGLLILGLGVFSGLAGTGLIYYLFWFRDKILKKDL